MLSNSMDPDYAHNLTWTCLRLLTKFISEIALAGKYLIRARKLFSSARIYEWKFGTGEWKLPFASPTGRVDFFGFVIIFEEKKNSLACFTACKSNTNTVKKDRSVGLKCH